MNTVFHTGLILNHKVLECFISTQKVSICAVVVMLVDDVFVAGAGQDNDTL